MIIIKKVIAFDVKLTDIYLCSTLYRVTRSKVVNLLIYNRPYLVFTNIIYLHIFTIDFE